MIELRVKFSDNDKHIHIFVGDEVIPVVTMHRGEVIGLDPDSWAVEERLEGGGSRVITTGYGDYHDMLGIAVGTAAGRKWERK